MNTFNSTRWAVAIAIVAGGTMTAACGTETTLTEPPSVVTRIDPPADVPKVRPDGTSEEALERRAAKNEEMLRGAGRWFGTP